MNESSKIGRVVKSTGSWYTVHDVMGTAYEARLRGKFKNLDLKVTNPIAVGDVVVMEPDNEGAETFVITEIQERQNYIVRQSSRNKHNAHIIASNVDQAVVIVALKQPHISTGFIDRFIVLAESFRIPVAIVFNKTDLLNKAQMKRLDYLRIIYSKLGYDVLETSCVTNDGMDQLQNCLNGKVSLIAGQSGVGKSTLINQLSPGLDLKTAPISQFNKKGTHTTTYVEMHDLGEGTFVIDSPGVRELGFHEISEKDLGHYYPEMRERLTECQFNDCTHEHEPNCAVLEAVEAGEINEGRYVNYLSMLESLREEQS